MKTSKYWMTAILLLLSISSFAQFKNQKTISVYIDGNCDMCKKNIEKAGNLKNQAQVKWNKDSHEAIVAYDSTKINLDTILKGIALIGYDNEKYLAPTEIYNALPDCCKYDRSLKEEEIEDKHNHNDSHKSHDNIANVQTPIADTDKIQQISNAYFSLKDALVKDDAKDVLSQSKALFIALEAVEMEKLPSNVHKVWMNVMGDLKSIAKELTEAQKITDQRKAFEKFSPIYYTLVKATPSSFPIYYQYCPMFNDGKGAYWLSKEESIKNPYYGATMMTCGSIKEILK